MENLPLEMQLKIFSFLDGKSLLSMASTDRSWRDLILNSHDLMRCINLKLTNFENQIIFLEAYGRGVASITIGRSSEEKSIELSSAKLKHILRLIPNVREIKFNTFVVPKVKKVIPNLPLARLQKLTLINNANDHRIFYFLDGCSNLKEYTTCIDKFNKKIKYFNRSAYWKWLNKQQQLAILNLGGYSGLIFFDNVKVNDLKINLKKLTITSAVNESDIIFDVSSMLQFLKCQKDLIEIDLNKLYNFYAYSRSLRIEEFSDIFKQIFYDMPKLKTLTFNGIDVCDSMNVSKTNTFLEKLKILTQNRQDHIGKYINVFPSIKNLKWETHPWSLQTKLIQNLQLISSKLSKLEKFKLCNLDLGGKLQMAKFSDKLTKISLFNCKLGSNDWKVMTDNMPSIEKLVLDMFTLLDESASHFKNWKCLKQIVFKCGFYQNKLIDILCQCPLLKLLKISDAMQRQFRRELLFADIKIELLNKKLEFEKHRASTYPGDASNFHSEEGLQSFHYIDNREDFFLKDYMLTSDSSDEESSENELSDDGSSEYGWNFMW